MKRVHALVSCVLTAAACASIAQAFVHYPIPGLGVSEEMATRLGCDIDQIKADAEAYKAEIRDHGGLPYVVIPRVGDTVCDVLAKLGRPERVETIQTQATMALNLWYRTGSTQTYDLQSHLVTLGPDESETRFVVTSVVW